MAGSTCLRTPLSHRDAALACPAAHRRASAGPRRSRFRLVTDAGWLRHQEVTRRSCGVVRIGVAAAGRTSGTGYGWAMMATTDPRHVIGTVGSVAMAGNPVAASAAVITNVVMASKTADDHHCRGDGQHSTSHVQVLPMAGWWVYCGNRPVSTGVAPSGWEARESRDGHDDAVTPLQRSSAPLPGKLNVSLQFHHPEHGTWREAAAGKLSLICPGFRGQTTSRGSPPRCTATPCGTSAPMAA